MKKKLTKKEAKNVRTDLNEIRSLILHEYQSQKTIPDTPITVRRSIVSKIAVLNQEIGELDSNIKEFNMRERQEDYDPFR